MSEPANKVEYLGDGVYGDYTSGVMRLYTSNGIEEKNDIFLDGDVIVSFFKFIEKSLDVKITVKPPERIQI